MNQAVLPAVLYSTRLCLRKPSIEDLNAVFKIHGNPATNQFNPSGPMQNLLEAEQLTLAWMRCWDRNGFGVWSIATSDAPQDLIGFGGISPKSVLGRDRLNLYYRFDPSAWGKGYALETGRAALHCAFGWLDQSNVVAVIRQSNLLSLKVAQRLGMLEIGVLDDVPSQQPSLVLEMTSSRFEARDDALTLDPN